MKLVRLYSDQPDRFLPIEFNDGLSAILAEIRVRENRDLHTHNLGKTTIGSLIDFCLIKGKDAKFFLFKHEDVFKSLCVLPRDRAPRPLVLDDPPGGRARLEDRLPAQRCERGGCGRRP